MSDNDGVTVEDVDDDEDTGVALPTKKRRGNKSPKQSTPQRNGGKKRSNGGRTKRQGTDGNAKDRKRKSIKVGKSLSSTKEKTKEGKQALDVEVEARPWRKSIIDGKVYDRKTVAPFQYQGETADLDDVAVLRGTGAGIGRRSKSVIGSKTYDPLEVAPFRFQESKAEREHRRKSIDATAGHSKRSNGGDQLERDERGGGLHFINSNRSNRSRTSSNRSNTRIESVRSIRSSRNSARHSRRRRATEEGSETYSLRGGNYRSSTTPSTVSRCKPHYTYIHEWLQSFFHWLGLRVGRYPILSIFLSVLATFAFGSGTLFTRVEVDQAELWYPRNSLFRKHGRIFSEHFSATTRTELLIASQEVTSSFPQGILTPSALSEAVELHNLVTGIKGYEEVCQRAWVGNGAPCVTSSVLEAFNFTVDGLSFVSIQDVISAQPVVSQVTGQELNLNTLLSKVKYRGGNTTKIKSAVAMRSIYFLDASKRTTDIMAFEERLFKALQRWTGRERGGEDGVFGGLFGGSKEESNNGNNRNGRDITLAFATQRSWSDESSRMIAADVPIMGIGISLMVIYVCLMLGKRPPVKSRVLLGLAVIVAVGQSLAIGFGVAGFLGIPESHPAVTRFHRRQGNKSTIGNSIRGRRLEEHEITTGDEYDDEDDVPLRLAIAMEEAGPSVTLTSLTDCLAFAVGSLVEIPAISFFCRTSACAIASVFVIQTTFFAGCLVLDERRVRAGMYDVFPCCSASTVAVPSDNKGDGEMDGDTVEVTHIAAGSKRSHRQEGKEDHHRTSTQSSLTTRFLRHVYVPFLEVPFIKVCVVLSFIALAAFSAYTGQHIEKGLETTTLLGTGSEVYNYAVTQERFFKGGLTTMHVILNEGNLDYSLNTVDTAMMNLYDRVRNLDFVLTPVNFWYVDFIEWSEAQGLSITSNNASDLIKMFVVARPEYGADIVFDKQTNVVKASRMRVVIHNAVNRDRRLKHMDAARKACITKELGSFPYQSNYGSTERYKIIDSTIYFSLLFTFLGVFVMLLLFQSLSSAILVTLMVALVCLNIVGMMHLWNLKINVITTVNLVMVVGFAVDYSAHIADMFVHSKGNRDRKMATSLITMGKSVFNGGCSTLLAVLMLSFSQSGGFRALFKMFLGMVGFGLVHGLMFLPVLLSLIGPSNDPTDTICAIGPRRYPSVGELLESRCNYNPRHADILAVTLRRQAGIRDLKDLALSYPEEIMARCGLQIAPARRIIYEAREICYVQPM